MDGIGNNDRSKAHALARRDLLKGAAVAVAAGLVPGSSTAAAPGKTAAATRRVDGVVAGAGTAEVETASGRVAGYLRGGIHAFKGIPYGDTTEGDGRFAPARKPKPWTGVRSCREYGSICPQDRGTGRLRDEEAFLFRWNDVYESEDCLRINVWTPGIHDGKKRPVMVWLHGGGFAAGSGHDLPAYDGENLARRGDVVVVSLNHRLNVLGFLDLSPFGERYADSANIGMLDIVAALEWVRDNIGQFGGDAGRVMIFGQSGGGAKVGTLLGMPAAKGLFHRAVIQSGSFTLSNTREKSRELCDLLLAELGIGPGSLDRLLAMPYSELRRASQVAELKANPPVGDADFSTIRKFIKRSGFAPAADGRVLPEIPFGEVAPAVSADVPVIVGTTLNELVTGMNHPEYELMTAGELERKVAALYGNRAGDIISVFRRRAPDAKPFDVWSRIATAPVREAAIRQARLKAAQGRAPAYLYWFTWQTAVLDGRPRAFHCAEIPFVFDNTDRCDSMTGGGPRARALAGTVADAWIAFARSGNPNHAGMQEWHPYSASTAPTMVFDDNVAEALDPDRDEQASVRET